ncbi:MAG: thiamine pyrophosphate-binding protein [Persicimonas sp.]
MAILKPGTDKIKGGEIVTRILAAEGVRRVFGIIDGTYFGMYSTFEDNNIELITPRHETSAAHMAGAYARLTGELGVCMASNGPGVANILPGVAVEEAEGNRVLLITSSRRQPLVYPDRGGTYQYFPQVDVIGAMAKWSCHVSEVDRVGEIMRHALRRCYQGRPGVVHVDVPEDIMNGTFELDPSWLRSPSAYRVDHRVEPAPELISRSADMLIDSELPLIQVGSGVIHAGASDLVHEIAEMLQAPITTSWAARAAVDERRQQVIPMIYLDAVKEARNTADLVLTLGSRLGETDWWGKAPYWAKPEDQKMIQVDIDETTLGANKPAELLVQADIEVYLQRLLAELKERRAGGSPARSRHLEGLRRSTMKRRAKLDKRLDSSSLPMCSAHIPVECQKVFDDDAILVIDGGNTAVWANFYHQVRTPNTMLSTPKMGMLGAGVSQALAAKAAHPDRQVYCIIGDGAMGFHPQELETAVRHDLPVVYLIACDKQWGMVKMNQQFALRPVKTLIKKSLDADETINADLGEIQWDALARSMGAHGERVADPNGLQGAIRRSLASGLPAVIHCDVDPVTHMWAPELKTFKDMHAEPAG